MEEVNVFGVQPNLFETTVPGFWEQVFAGSALTLGE